MIIKKLGVPARDVEKQLPQRMRERIEYERILRKREQKARRAKFRRGSILGSKRSY